MLEASSNLKRWPQILGWACYLACSWTWCIGMFLPVLLVRDYGVWGFVVFAVPNVVGAAAMGWVLRKPGASEKIVRQHAIAARLFSIVTIAFQCFFAGWMSTALWMGPFLAITSIVLCSPAFLVRRKNERIMASVVLAVVVFLLSAAATLYWNTASTIVTPMPKPQEINGLMFLAPICVFGFALCPYLDLTFHTGRQLQTPHNALISFVFGFGVLFLAIIYFTYRYTGLLHDLSWVTSFSTLSPAATAGLSIHIFGQLAFTCAVHEGEVVTAKGPVAETLRGRRVVSFVLNAAIAFAAGVLCTHLSQSGRLAPAEIIYRLFMSFYGLVFPAYVWLCMIPTWRDPQRPTQRHIVVWLAACALAAPCYWMGFIERVEWWLIPGLAVVLSARLLIPPASRGSSPPPAEPSPSLVPVHSGPSELSVAATPER